MNKKTSMKATSKHRSRVTKSIVTAKECVAISVKEAKDAATEDAPFSAVATEKIV